MKEIVKVKLENEMDLILAHKRAMKICELCGLSLIVQTSFATAVSEISRTAIEFGKNSALFLGIDTQQGKKNLQAIVVDSTDYEQNAAEAASYAKRLVDDLTTEKNAKEFKIILKQNLNPQQILTDLKIQTFIDYFKLERPLSAYDELRRKNILLQELADKLRENENEYKVLTDSLPLMMFSANNRGQISYTNKWLQDFLPAIPKEINSAEWLSLIEPTDHPAFAKDLNNSLQRQTSLTGQYRFKEKKSGSYVWHLITFIPLKNDKEIIQRWIGFIVDVSAQKNIEQALKNNRELQKTQNELYNNQEELQRKVIELNRSNYELEQFAHLATHDLQEPLRKLFFVSDMLKKKYSGLIDAAGMAMLDNMTRSATRMKELITDLLTYSQLQQQKIIFETVDLNEVLVETLKDLDISIRDKNATFEIAPLPKVTGNAIRLRQLFSNLVSNSLKYSRPDIPPHISITVAAAEFTVTILFKDNGIGFEDIYKEKIFGLFERLHTKNEFPGTGIGLSICKRIVELHHGKISATSELNQHSTFEIILPVFQKNLETEKA